MQQWDDWEQDSDCRSKLSNSWVFWLLAASSLLLLAVLLLQQAAPAQYLDYVIEKQEQLGEEYKRGESTGELVNEIRDGKIYPRCPADGRPLQPHLIPATAKDIDIAIASAASAQKLWSRTTFLERKKVLRTLLQYVLTHQDEIATACCLDSGKTKIDASFGEVLVTAEKLQWTIKHGESALSPSRRPTNLLMCYKSNRVYYEPLGVVAACVSWNYPFHNLISPVISALFSGNAIVVKPSEQTAWSSLYFTRIIKSALGACGHSSDLVQTIICLPIVADHFTSHPIIKHITFIGSRPVAHKVAASASKSLTALTIELGGKDPAIVLDDARTISDLDNVASILLRGVFQSAGQNCIGIERVIALPDVHDKLLARILPKVKALTIGHVLRDMVAPDIGAMISGDSFDRLEALIKHAVSQGATLHCGGSRYHHPSYPRGTYFTPTLLSNVTPSMEIAKTELFAPVFLLMRVDSVNHAIEIANSPEYALGASVFGHDQHDVQKCVEGVKAGSVAVNDFGAFYVCSMPFGGRDGSGYGRFGGEEGLRGLCNVKSVSREVFWARWLGIKTQIPKPLQYPVDGMRGWQACKGVVETGYGLGAVAKARGVAKLLGALMGRNQRKSRPADVSEMYEKLSKDW